MRNGPSDNGSKEDFEQEIRRVRVLGLCSKGLTQSDIAHELNVDQSTVSRDLRYIKDKAKRKVVEVSDNLSFEFMRYLAGIDEIARELWKIASLEIDHADNDGTVNPNTIIATNMNNKNRIAALTLLLETYRHRLDVITGGSKTTHDHIGTTLMSHGYYMKQEMKTPKEREQDRIEEHRRMLDRLV